MDVKLELYRVFYSVAVQKSFTAGAESLFLTQSAVSQQIKNLEEAMGAPLFVRSKKGAELTQEGQVLFRYVSEALGLLEQAERHIGKVRSLEGGQLRIGVGDTVSRYLLLPVLERFSEAYPKVELRIHNRVSRESIELLKGGRIDLALVNMTIDWEGTHKVGEIPVQDCFVVGREFAKRLPKGPMTYDGLARLPLILLDNNSSSRHFVDARFAERGIILRPEIEIGSHDLLLDFAAANLGAACVVEEFSGSYLSSGRVVKVNAEPLPKRAVGVFLLSENSSPAAEALLDMMGFKSR